MIGMTVVFCGIGIGAMSSGFFTGLLLGFMGEVSDVSLMMEPRAAIVTVIVFTVLFMISGLNSYRTIYQYRLIDLLNADKEREVLPKQKSFWGYLAAVMILAGYFISMKIDVDVSGYDLIIPTLVILALISLGSYLFAVSGIGGSCGLLCTLLVSM
ncbi:MAG: hypothetical protein GX567_14715 [Clostridia bacterium]|nr:hypothetical protein [Clostridia bacterium]